MDTAFLAQADRHRVPKLSVANISSLLIANMVLIKLRENNRRLWRAFNFSKFPPFFTPDAYSINSTLASGHACENHKSSPASPSSSTMHWENKAWICPSTKPLDPRTAHQTLYGTSISFTSTTEPWLEIQSLCSSATHSYKQMQQLLIKTCGGEPKGWECSRAIACKA